LSNLVRKVREIYLNYTGLIEPCGLDEAWLDITGSAKLFGGHHKVICRFLCFLRLRLRGK